MRDELLFNFVVSINPNADPRMNIKLEPYYGIQCHVFDHYSLPQRKVNNTMI
jgi:hypothetical protein